MECFGSTARRDIRCTRQAEPGHRAAGNGRRDRAPDIYVYAGLERDNTNFGTISTAPFGFGNPLYSDALCFIENFNTPAPLTSPVTGVLSNTACSVNVKQFAEITAGLWYNLYKGPYVRLTGGLQYEFIHRDTFPGLAGATPAAGFISPSTNESIFMTSLRYYFP
jgi:hypothetical protein